MAESCKETEKGKRQLVKAPLTNDCRLAPNETPPGVFGGPVVFWLAWLNTVVD